MHIIALILAALSIAGIIYLACGVFGATDPDEARYKWLRDATKPKDSDN